MLLKQSYHSTSSPTFYSSATVLPVVAWLSQRRCGVPGPTSRYWLSFLTTLKIKMRTLSICLGILVCPSVRCFSPLSAFGRQAEGKGLLHIRSCLNIIVLSLEEARTSLLQSMVNFIRLRWKSDTFPQHSQYYWMRHRIRRAESSTDLPSFQMQPSFSATNPFQSSYALYFLSYMHYPKCTRIYIPLPLRNSPKRHARPQLHATPYRNPTHRAIHDVCGMHAFSSARLRLDQCCDGGGWKRRHHPSRGR
jgi:hypothetical protein